MADPGPGLAEQGAALGLPPEVLAAMARGASPEPPLEILPDNWPAVEVFVAMGTQWRRAGMAGLVTGLDYAALPAVCGALGHDLDAELLTRLRVIEGQAIAAMAERR